MVKSHALIACVILLLARTDPPSQLLSGKVVAVTDGDTITLLQEKSDGGTIKIRLEGIDAPESSQAFGTKSKEALKELVGGQLVVVSKTGEDKYGRSLGFVRIGDVDVNSRLVQEGCPANRLRSPPHDSLCIKNVSISSISSGLLRISRIRSKVASSGLASEARKAMTSVIKTVLISGQN